MFDWPPIREQHLKDSKEIPWVRVRVRVRVRVKVGVILKCNYYSIGVHIYHSLRFTVWVRSYYASVSVYLYT